MNFCPECGTALVQAAKFCGECGHKIPAPSQATETTNEPQESPLHETRAPEPDASNGVLVDADPELIERARQGDPFAVNDLAHLMNKAGLVDDAMDMFAMSARAGVPWAMSNFSWAALQGGSPADALALYS